jgi:hypothetical protein
MAYAVTVDVATEKLACGSMYVTDQPDAALPTVVKTGDD